MPNDADPLIRKLSAIFPLTELEAQTLEGACSQIVSFSAKQDIVREGDRPRYCNLLLDGWVSRYKITEDGKRQILSFQFPGDIFDAQSFLLDEMDHSISAVSACKVGLIPHETMKQITEACPRITRAIWKETLVDAAAFQEWVVNVGRRDAYVGMTHLFCEVFTRLKAIGLATDNMIEWPLTQTDMGDVLGLSNVHVNRVLQEIRAAGLVTLERSRLTIHDWAGLVYAGQFEPRYLHLRGVAS